MVLEGMLFNHLELRLGEFFRKIFALQKSGISEKELREVGKTIENLYAKYGDNELFRTEFEALLVKLLNKNGKEAVQVLFTVLPMEETIKEEVISDLKEAIRTMEIQRGFKEKAEELESRLSKVFD